MDFIHYSYQPGETIAAIATPLGEGGVAIIRISGTKAIEVAGLVFSGKVEKFASHTLHYGLILNDKKERVDDVLLAVMKAPRSYTGEDTVEIHCHGGSLITRRVLEVVLQAGARQAYPGEFTFRSYINGKLDLAQAEAVQSLISAKNERALDAAEQQLQGRLSSRVSIFQKELTGIAAILEAWVDFPEEGLEFATVEEICRDLEKISDSIEALIRTFHNGKIIHEGVTLCLIGSPNVGKSSLMNALLDKDRAIVSPIPGTTRDVLEDHLRINGLNFRLIDTAGIRDSDEPIEKEGIRRTRQAMAEADIVLMVLDAAEGLREDERLLLQQFPPQKTIVAWNKTDIIHPKLPKLSLPHVVTVSAKEKQGLEKLHQKIDEVIWLAGPPSLEEVVVTQVRHKEALEGSLNACHKVIEGLKSGVSPEFVCVDMRLCLTELGKIIGVHVSEDILSAIFSKFCIGK